MNKNNFCLKSQWRTIYATHWTSIQQ